MKAKTEGKLYIALKLHRELTTAEGVRIILPEDCAGIFFAWKNIKAGAKFEGEDTEFNEIILANKDVKGGKDV